MVLLYKLCAEALHARLNCEIGLHHSLVCAGQGLSRGFKENYSGFNLGVCEGEFRWKYPPSCLDHTLVYQGGCEVYTKEKKCRVLGKKGKRN